MATRSFIVFYAIGFYLIIAVSCRTTVPLVSSKFQLDTSISPTKIPMEKLIFEFKKYHGKYIETTGLFYSGFEMFAIFPDPQTSMISQGFWLKTGPGIDIKKDVNGKKITVRGILDTTYHGHMESYLDSIVKIYSWQQK